MQLEMAVGAGKHPVDKLQTGVQKRRVHAIRAEDAAEFLERIQTAVPAQVVEGEATLVVAVSSYRVYILSLHSAVKEARARAVVCMLVSSSGYRVCRL